MNEYFKNSTNKNNKNTKNKSLLLNNNQNNINNFNCKNVEVKIKSTKNNIFNQTFNNSFQLKNYDNNSNLEINNISNKKENNNKINNISLKGKNSIKENMNYLNEDLINFYNSIKENSPNIFKVNSSEKQLSQKEILRLKLDAFLIIKKYYLHRKSKSEWIKRKKKLIKLSDNFYRNLLLSRAFYGFSLNSKRKSLYNLIKNNYIDFRIKELASNFIKTLKFCYNAKNLENKAFFELTKNKLRRILNEMKSQMVYNRTIDKYLFTQVLNNDTAVQFCKIIIYLSNSFNIKKLYRYEYNINAIIHKEEFTLKQKCFFFLKNQGNIIENELNKKAEKFNKDVIILNDKKKFIMHLEEEIIRSYKTKFFKEKIFFMRGKNYILSKKIWKQKSPLFGPNREIIKNFHNNKLKKYSFKIIKRITKKRKQKIENLQIKNFMKNVNFFFYQCRKKTIESLIIEGIRQKIKKYNKFLFMKILLYSKIECLKQYRVLISTRKKYQKKLAFNLLKRNVLLKNTELLCNIKFFFNFCFKLKIKMIKQRKIANNLIFKQAIQKFVIHLIQMDIERKKNLLKKKEECKINLENIRKKNFLKNIKNKLGKKKYDNLIYSKHAKIFFYAIGIINLKNKCNVEIKLKSKLYIKKKTTYFFNIFKSRAISNYKINSKKQKLNKFLLKHNFNIFIKEVKLNLLQNKKMLLVSNIQKKLIKKKYLEAINICYKMDNIYKRVDEYYATKRKKNYYYILKKRYQDSIKYSMLSIRFNEYLIISSFNSFLGVISKNKNKNNANYINNKYN